MILSVAWNGNPGIIVIFQNSVKEFGNFKKCHNITKEYFCIIDHLIVFKHPLKHWFLLHDMEYIVKLQQIWSLKKIPFPVIARQL